MVIKLIKDRLEKTRNYLHQQLGRLVAKGNILEPELFSELEAVLIQADLGVNITGAILGQIQKEKSVSNEEEVFSIVRQELLGILKEKGVPESVQLNKNPKGPTIILILGANGSGKTTVIAKLAHKFKVAGSKVLLAAADTFRAAAIEQLEVWAQRLDVDVVKHVYGADPSAVAYDAVSAAVSRGMDFLIIDTAGRFHTKTILVEELKKIDRTINKRYPGAPHEKLLVIDATTGQNALVQAREFHQELNLTGIVVTKLDGTAKGGVLVGIQKELGVPVKFIGIGQELTDLQEFDPQSYVEAVV